MDIAVGNSFKQIPVGLVGVAGLDPQIGCAPERAVRARGVRERDEKVVQEFQCARNLPFRAPGDRNQCWRLGAAAAPRKEKALLKIDRVVPPTDSGKVSRCRVTAIASTVAVEKRASRVDVARENIGGFGGVAVSGCGPRSAASGSGRCPAVRRQANPLDGRRCWPIAGPISLPSVSRSTATDRMRSGPFSVPFTSRP